MTLIRNLKKLTHPQPPGRMENYIAVVGGSASVPVELHLEGVEGTDRPAGVDIVFLIDNSGSMENSDPNGDRYAAIKALSLAFTPTRDPWDRIAVIVFCNDEVIVSNPANPWKSWSDLPSLVNEIMEDGPTGNTPMEPGMDRATQLLSTQNGFYKMVILLSDGEPIPDDELNPQTNTIINYRVPEAFEKSVLYSTVYLRVPDSNEPLDNALLEYIARHTDHITDYEADSEPPIYYFRIENTAQLVQAYRELFDDTCNRTVPRDVNMVEQVNARLFLDPQFPPQFVGDGFDRVQNVIGTPLNDALNEFLQTGRFEISLNELTGPADLKFAVKLDLETVAPEEFQQGYVLLPVDQPYPESKLRWLEPAAGAGSVPIEIELPQAEIKFELGLHVTKSLQDSDSLVMIAIDNLDQEPVKWFELFEHPSGFINPVDVQDNLGFKPLAMLYRSRIVPWFISQIPANLIPPPGPERALFLERVREALRAHVPFMALASLIDPLLSQFSTLDSTWFVDHQTFWSSREVRGFYRLASLLPGRASRYLRFGVEDISYVKSGEVARVLRAPVDALTAKEGDPQLSLYMAEELEAQEILPNPLRNQIAHPQPQPDLYVSTGLKAHQWKLFANLFRGQTLSGGVNPWDLLDSADITPFWKHNSDVIGVWVRLHNGGAPAPAGTLLKMRTCFLPFTGLEFLPPYPVSPPLIGTRMTILPQIPHHEPNENLTLSLQFNSLRVLGTQDQASVGFLQKVRKAIGVTLVEINPAEGEVMLINNRAIEVVPLECK